jgi:hypothetical protein
MGDRNPSCRGGLAGYGLSSIPELHTFKLLNLAGLFYALLLVLSEMIATDSWKDFCVRKLAPSVSWAHTAIPAGAIFGSLIAVIMRKPSSGAVGFFFLHSGDIPYLY